MKKFAFFLPQYYETKENNKWWGNGFTEWTHVCAAKPLCKNHLQPQTPLNNNYYNLLNKDTVNWQTNLMTKFSIDGLIYYHYYFDGDLLLEKPAENLLKWNDINQPFFFCWANHSWYKSNDGKRALLKEQIYGTVESWEKHFNYLLPFFLDDRYEKKNNKPLFMLFNTAFTEKKDMMNFFDRKCKENGFDGIQIIETFNTDSANINQSLKKFVSCLSTETAQVFLREPSNSNLIYLYSTLYSIKRIPRIVCTLMVKFHIKGFVRHFNGNVLFDKMIYNEPHTPDIIPGLFFSWDNTPRHGNRGYIISKPNKQKFMHYMDSIKDSEYVFINAWNEWAEGMILEPTEFDGYENLEWIKEWDSNNK